MTGGPFGVGFCTGGKEMNLDHRPEVLSIE
jgi:hypothetical protein